jgi:hypothetical protein
MADPLKYFPEPKQKELANQVWNLAATKKDFYSSVCQVSFHKFVSPDAKRVVHAKDWVTYWRQDGEPENNDKVNTQLGHAPGYYSGECIADVEHFFVASFIHLVIGPSITQVAVFGYETLDTALKKPLLNALDAYNNGNDITDAFIEGFPSGWRGWLNSARWNYGQAMRAQSGIAFAAELIEGRGLIPGIDDTAVALARAIDEIRRGIVYLRQAIPPPPRLPKFDTTPPGTCPIDRKPGVPDKEFFLDFKDQTKRSLSAIAKTLYGSWDYWPLLWWHNSHIANPNKLQGLKSIRYREKHTYSPEDFRKAKEHAPSWKSFPA